jgi:hypothetical protein
MHLAAAVEVPPGMPKNRPCVVVAGGREPPHWEAYPHHQFLHRAGSLLCCDDGGCWKSRVRPLGATGPNDTHDKIIAERLKSGSRLRQFSAALGDYLVAGGHLARDMGKKVQGLLFAPG